MKSKRKVIKTILMIVLSITMGANSVMMLSAEESNQEEALTSSIPNNSGYIFEEEYKTVSNIKEGTTISEFKNSIEEYTVKVFQLQKDETAEAEGSVVEKELFEGSIGIGMTVRILKEGFSYNYQVVDESTIKELNKGALKNARAGFIPRLNANGISGSRYWQQELNPFYPNLGMPNCTAYAFGRLLELNNGIDVGVPRGNAGTWYGAATISKGQTPKLGAIMCFGTRTGGLGHVAVVEQVLPNGDVVASNSNWGGPYFFTTTHTKASGYNNYDSALYFQGFIYAYKESAIPPVYDAPTISNIKTSNVDSTGYTVTATLTNVKNITEVKFPTWTVANGQDDIVWGKGTISGNTVSYRVKRSDHKNETGAYATRIYVYQKQGDPIVRTVPNVMVVDVHWEDREDGKYLLYKDGTPYQGWYKDMNTSWYLTSTGKRITGLQKINGNNYYFDETDGMLRNWHRIADKSYYFGEDGIMRLNWQRITDKSYYFGEDGNMRRGWQQIAGKSYYFGEDGVMRLNWQRIADKSYYFGEDGNMRRSWQQIAGQTYYFGQDGVMVRGTIVINGVTYKFNSEGHLIK